MLLVHRIGDGRAGHGARGVLEVARPRPKHELRGHARETDQLSVVVDRGANRYAALVALSDDDRRVGHEALVHAQGYVPCVHHTPYFSCCTIRRFGQTPPSLDRVR